MHMYMYTFSIIECTCMLTNFVTCDAISFAMNLVIQFYQCASIKPTGTLKIII